MIYKLYWNYSTKSNLTLESNWIFFVNKLNGILCCNKDCVVCYLGRSSWEDNVAFQMMINLGYLGNICHVIILFWTNLLQIIISRVDRARPYSYFLSREDHFKLVFMRFEDLHVWESSNIKRQMLQQLHSKHIHYIYITLLTNTKYDSSSIHWNSDDSFYRCI